MREHEEILTIPNAGGMVAEVKLHETVVKQVQIGHTCTIAVDALPGAQFQGRVGFISVLPDQQSRWSNPNTRVYRTDVELTPASDDMRPGMSCAIEILIEDLDDVLHVPVQAVTRLRQGNVCFVATDRDVERRTVRVGRYNEQWVQILSGVSEGEIVLLNPPPGFDVEEEAEEIDEPDEPGRAPELGRLQSGEPSEAR